jgi:hypothetical protein
MLASPAKAPASTRLFAAAMPEGSSNITTLRGTTKAYTLDRLSRESPGL